MTLNVFIGGDPAPQGSKRHIGGGRMIESSRHVRPWRGRVKASVQLQVLARRLAPIEGPVRVELEFVLRRPKHAPRGGWMASRRPDVDKLARAVLDALGDAGVYADDAQVTTLIAAKRLAAPGEPTGVQVIVEPQES